MKRNGKAEDPRQMVLLVGDLIPNGNGYAVVPRKLQPQEISSADAARLLKVCRSSLSTIINTQLGQEHLRWRWISEKKGKRVFELESVVAYKQAMQELD
jgi:hypothetical protein